MLEILGDNKVIITGLIVIIIALFKICYSFFNSKLENQIELNSLKLEKKIKYTFQEDLKEFKKELKEEIERQAIHAARNELNGYLNKQYLNEKNN